jgi:hypothetical protein
MDIAQCHRNSGERLAGHVRYYAAKVVLFGTPKQADFEAKIKQVLAAQNCK